MTGDTHKSPGAGQWCVLEALGARRWRVSRASSRPAGEPLVNNAARPADRVRAQPQRLRERAIGAPTTQRPPAHPDTVQYIRHTQHRVT